MTTADLIPLPQGWPEHTCAGVVRAIGLAHWVISHARGWCAESRIARVRLAAENDRLKSEVALLKEELRIKDARMERIPPAERPHYPPHERLAILALKAARGWNNAQVARHLLVTASTVANWLKRVAEGGEQALVKTPQPVNRFPDLVTDVVQRLRTLCPSMGLRRIADNLARAGLHLSKSTVSRCLDKPPPPKPAPQPATSDAAEKPRTVTAKYPGHVWNLDLTTVPINGGWWVPWWPLALLPHWPFCWWVGAVLDHYSRKVIAIKCWAKQPTTEKVLELLGEAANVAGAPPKYTISDQGTQFRGEYQDWRDENGVKPRYGAVGRYGSIAVLERFWRSMKEEATRKMLVPYTLPVMQAELAVVVEWYNSVRAHQGLFGATPDEVYFGTHPARDGPSLEVRGEYPTGGEVLRGRPGTVVDLHVTNFRGRPHLPVVELRQAA